MIDYVAGEPAATDLIESLFSDGVSMSAVTYMEVYDGLFRAGTEPVLLRTRTTILTARTPVLPLTRDTAEVAATLRVALRNAGRRVTSRAYDLLIAATAVEHDLTLVTRNVRDYEDIPGLKLHGRD